MGWFADRWWRKPSLTLSGGEPVPRGLRTIGPTGAMQIAAWWACVRLIAQTVATLPLGFYLKTANGRDSAPTHDLYNLLHDSPNADQTACEFWECMILNLCVYGNAFALKDVRADGSLISLTPLNGSPEAMTVRRGANGRLAFSFTLRGRRYLDLDEDLIFHIRGFGDGGDLGLSPVAYARQTLGLADALATSASSTFANGMKASVFFTGPPNVKLTAEQRKEFKERFIDPYSGADATASAGLLEHGFDVKTVSLPPRDAEMLLSTKFNVEEVCRWHGVPPVLIGHAADGQTMWGSGVEQIMLGWLTLGLRPYLTRIEQRIKKSLLTAKERTAGYYAEFNVEGLLRADSAGRAAMLSSLAQNGFLTRDEGRAMDNRGPMPGGDVLTVQSNLLPLDQLGQANAVPANQQLRSAFDAIIEDRLQAILAKKDGS
jgi:HK97 family phage portal protein